MEGLVLHVAPSLSQTDTLISDSIALLRVACDLPLRGVCGRPTMCAPELSQPIFVNFEEWAFNVSFDVLLLPIIYLFL